MQKKGEKNAFQIVNKNKNYIMRGCKSQPLKYNLFINFI